MLSFGDNKDLISPFKSLPFDLVLIRVHVKQLQMKMQNNILVISKNNDEWQKEVSKQQLCISCLGFVDVFG